MNDVDHSLKLARAFSLAAEAHDGQQRRHGAPYLEHPLAVRMLTEDLALACNIAIDDDVRAAALLHDVVEDSSIGLDEVRARFGPETAVRVDLLSKRDDSEAELMRYYARLRAEADDSVRLLKVCDRLHNLSELHLRPDLDKLKRTVDDTLTHVLPLARGASAPANEALVRALHLGVRSACGAQGARPPREIEGASTRLPQGLYAVVHPHEHTPAELRCRVSALLSAGVAMLQLRAKGTSDRRTLELLEELLPLTRKAGVPLLLNDRADIAFSAGADGVHVGQDDLPPLHARRIVGEHALVGTSSHTESELLAACAEGSIDHVAVGPVFASPTKSGHAPVVGIAPFARRAALSPVPVVAIGGISSPERVVACARAGARLIAAVSAFDLPPHMRIAPLAVRMASAFAAARAP